MTIGSALPPEEPAIVFYIGQHETQRNNTVSSELLTQAQELGYDFLTIPITTTTFHERVVALVSEHYSLLNSNSISNHVPLPLISPLTPADTNLTPENSNVSRVAIVSPWMDLGSQDPIIAQISRQVFNLEVAYAAFSGVSNIVIHGPMEGADVVQFARAIQEGLGLGPYVQLHVLLPMSGELELEYGNVTHLSELINNSKDGQFEEDSEQHEPYAQWESWNTIRTICQYSHKLSIGTECNLFVLSSLLSSVR